MGPPALLALLTAFSLLPPIKKAKPLPGFEHGTFALRVRRSTTKLQWRRWQVCRKHCRRFFEDAGAKRFKLNGHPHFGEVSRVLPLPCAASPLFQSVKGRMVEFMVDGDDLPGEEKRTIRRSRAGCSGSRPRPSWEGVPSWAR